MLYSLILFSCFVNPTRSESIGEKIFRKIGKTCIDLSYANTNNTITTDNSYWTKEKSDERYKVSIISL